MSPALRDAATLVLWRGTAASPEFLMGRRGGKAAFMPGKLVFPGGAAEPGDAQAGPEAARDPLAATAIRELWEETGLVLGNPSDWRDPPPGWEGFAATGHRPDPALPRLFFRAITPAGRPRRFDARFYLAPAAALAPGRLGGDGELAELGWITPEAAAAADLPFATRLAVAEAAALVAAGGIRPDRIPLFQGDAADPHFLWIDAIAGQPAQ